MKMRGRPGAQAQWRICGKRAKCGGCSEPLMKVRAAALKRFSENNVREGAPLATLEDVLVPIYMFHRYQVEAAAKSIGGLNYTFALRGDGEIPAEIVAADEQRKALDAVLATLTAGRAGAARAAAEIDSAAAAGISSERERGFPYPHRAGV